MPAQTRPASRAPFDTANFILPAEWHTLGDLLGGADTVVLMLQDGQIQQLSADLAARLGYAQEELAGQPFERILPRENSESGGWEPAPDEDALVRLQDRWGGVQEFAVLENRIDPLSEARCTVWILRPLLAGGDPQAAGARLLAIAERLPDLVLICGPAADIRNANRAFDALAGRRRGPLPALVHADDRGALTEALQRATAAESAPLAMRIRRADGGWSHVAGTVSNLLSHPDVQGLLLNVRDVTGEMAEQQRGAGERKRLLHYLNRLLRMAQRPQANLDMALKVILKSASKALSLQRCAYWDIGAQDPRCVMAYDDQRQNFVDEARDGPFTRAFVPLLRKTADDGRQLAFVDVDRDPLAALHCEYFHAAGIKSLILTPVQRPDAPPGLLVCSDPRARQWRKDETAFTESIAAMISAVHREIDRSRSESRLRDIRLQDRLTGLPNRDFLMRRAAEIFPQLSAKSDSLAAFFIDLDGFTEINDELGHLFGDEVLKAAALRLQNTVRRDDLLVRLDSDAFMLLARNLGDMQVAEDIAQQIVDSMRGVFSLQGRELSMTASVGVALFPHDGTDLDTLMKKADRALYQAKSAGRGQYRMSAPRIEDGLALQDQLRQALARGELQHYYQPQVDLRSGRVRTVEAMLRWHHPRHGLLQPASFLPLAERSGLMHEISAWVLSDVCAQVAAWNARGLDGFSVAIKLSSAQLADPRLAPSLETALRGSGIPARRLELEVKESDMLQQNAAADELLGRAAGMQIGLSVDGVSGAGDGRMDRLRRYPVRKLKIEPAAAGEDIADAVVSMAHPAGMDVVAKGVETSQQVDYLRQHGCDIAQGYYYTQPLTGDQFEKWLNRR